MIPPAPVVHGPACSQKLSGAVGPRGQAHTGGTTMNEQTTHTAEALLARWKEVHDELLRLYECCDALGLDPEVSAFAGSSSTSKSFNE